jgi:hypothetical protein
MAVAYHGVDPGQGGDFFGRALRITAGDQDACGWVFPMDFAQEGAGRTIRLRGHAASIGNDYIGPGWTGSRPQPALAQLGAYDFAVCAAGPASEVLNMVFCHVASLIK